MSLGGWCLNKLKDGQTCDEYNVLRVGFIAAQEGEAEKSALYDFKRLAGKINQGLLGGGGTVSDALKGLSTGPHGQRLCGGCGASFKLGFY